MVNQGIIRCIALFILIGLIGCQPDLPQAPKTTGLPMKIAKYYWPGEYWKEIAEKKGWFKEAGLNVELIDTNPDYFQSLQDMVDGKMDSNDFTLFDLTKYNAEGADLVGVIAMDNSWGIEGIIAKNEIKTVRNLKGKKIAVSKDTYLEYILSVALKKAGLTLDDVITIDIPPRKVAEEFSKGTIDAVVTWEPYVEQTQAIEDENVHKIFNTAEIPGISPSLETFHRSFIEERPGDIQAFVGVWNKTVQFTKENPKESLGIIAQIYNQTPGEVEVFAQTVKILDLRDNLTTFAFGSGFDSLHGSIRKINDFLIVKGIAKEQLDSTEFLDARFIRNLGRNSGPSVK